MLPHFNGYICFVINSDARLLSDGIFNLNTYILNLRHSKSLIISQPSFYRRAIISEVTVFFELIQIGLD